MNSILKWALIIIAIPIIIYILLNIGMYIWFRLIPILLNPTAKAIVSKDDQFEVITPINTNGSTHWHAPYSGDFKCTIPKGTILIAPFDGDPQTRDFSCIPKYYKEFEEQFVPESIRKNEKYNGYSFVLSYNDIGKRIKFVNKK